MSGWSLAQVRRLFRIVNGGTPTTDPINWDGGVRWATPVDLARVDGEFVDETQRHLTTAGLVSGSRSVPAGSLILSTRAPIGYVAQTTREMAFNQGCRGLVPAMNMDIRYFRYQLSALRDDLQSLGAGSTFQELSTEALATMRLTNPDIVAQRAIADFLDAETARIDALIEKKRRMIELLQQRYWSWVSERIQHLNAPKVQLRRGLVWITDGPFGSSLTSSHYTDPGARVVRLSNIGMAEFKNKDEAYISADHYATLLKHRVRAGNLLIAGLGDANNHVGRGCVAPELGSAIVKADCYCAMVDQRTANPQFLALYLSSPLGRNAVAGLSRGSTRTRINLDVAKSVPIFLPSLSDQTSIVTEASRRRKAASSAQDSLGNQIELLTEHRQALITAAVAGEIGVPRSAAS